DMHSSGTSAYQAEVRLIEHRTSAEHARGRVTVRERLKVLIVDDDPLIAEMYRLRLSAEGYEVAIARDGEEGLAMASATRPAFICLDYRLPGIDGLEALDRLRAEPTTNSIPVLMLSNDGDPGMRERGLRLGALNIGIKAEITPGRLAEFIARGEGALLRSTADAD
ncbi:MAG: response regulator, partial [Candidatus Dormiibacterota bacterium]